MRTTLQVCEKKLLGWEAARGGLSGAFRVFHLSPSSSPSTPPNLRSQVPGLRSQEKEGTRPERGETLDQLEYSTMWTQPREICIYADDSIFYSSSTGRSVPLVSTAHLLRHTPPTSYPFPLPPIPFTCHLSPSPTPSPPWQAPLALPSLSINISFPVCGNKMTRHNLI